MCNNAVENVHSAYSYTGNTAFDDTPPEIKKRLLCYTPYKPHDDMAGIEHKMLIYNYFAYCFLNFVYSDTACCTPHKPHDDMAGIVHDMLI